MSDEKQLLADFAGKRSEDAFAGIVRLHARLVFAAAFRQLGDRRLAEEVTQNVFLALAAKAGSLHGNATLAGWLYRTAIHQARQRGRAEMRRQRREKVAALCAESAREGDSSWANLIPLLDEALASLRDGERLAVMLHYMEGRTLREIGSQLGLGEDAIRKRVQQARMRLAVWFEKRGLAVSSSALAAALSLEGIPPLSAALIPAILSSVAASAGAGSLISIAGILMASAKTKMIVGTALALALAAPLVFQHRKAELPTERASSALPHADPPALDTGSGNASKSQPAPGRADAASVLVSPRGKSLLERINEGDESFTRLSREQTEAFIARNRTNSESLLAAYRATHDLEYLRRAARSFPTNPAVLLRANAHHAFPEDRREWLDRYKQADQGNSLPYYLSAADYFKSGELESAFQDLAQAGQKAPFQDHVTEQMLALEEMYLGAGYSAADAKAIAAFGMELPHLSQLTEMSRSMLDLATQYQSAGDTASAQNLASMGIQLAHHLNGLQEGGNILGQIVALRMERSFLEQLDPARPYPFLNGSAADLIAAGQLREQAIRNDAGIVERWIPEASEADIIHYFDRLKLHGESAAIEWLKSRRPAP